MSTTIEKLKAKTVVLSDKKYKSIVSFNDTKINYLAPIAMAFAIFGFFFLPIIGTVISLVLCYFSFKMMRNHKATGLYTTYSALVLSGLQGAFFILIGVVYLLTAGFGLIYQF